MARTYHSYTAEYKTGGFADVLISDEELQESTGPQDFFVMNKITDEGISSNGTVEIDGPAADMLPEVLQNTP